MKVLPEMQVAIFHTFVAKKLFVLKHAQPDISVAVAFCVHELRTLTKMTGKS